jgi:hypothetical protein
MKPTRQQETGMALIALAIIFLFLFLSSCSTKKVVTEYVAVHDTTWISHSDTIRDYKVVRDTVVDWKIITTHDTLHHEVERVVTLNEKGDTISKREWERLWQKIHDLQLSVHNQSHSDSSSYLKAQNDSLRAVLKAQESKKEVKRTTRPRLWEYIVFVALLALWVGLVMWLRRIWKKS